VQLLEMTWRDVEAHIQRRTRGLAILPAGSVEQHSLCMPIGTDTFIAEAIASAIGNEVDSVVFPTVRPGLSQVPHLAFPGTISHTSTTVIQAIIEILLCAHRHGFRDFFVLNAHGLNTSPLACALQDAAVDLHDCRFILQDWWQLPDVAALLDRHTTRGGHATAGELALMMFLHPQLVRKDKRLGKHEVKAEYWVSLDRVCELTEAGNLGGNQQEATPELGKSLFRAIVAGCLKRIQDMAPPG